MAKLTPQDRIVIRQRIRRGDCYSAIARDYNLSKCYISKIAQAMGMPRKGYQRPPRCKKCGVRPAPIGRRYCQACADEIVGIVERYNKARADIALA